MGPGVKGGGFQKNRLLGLTIFNVIIFFTPSLI